MNTVLDSAPHVKQAQRDARIARLARLITVYRKLQATAEPQPHEIAMVEYRFADLLGRAN